MLFGAIFTGLVSAEAAGETGSVNVNEPSSETVYQGVNTSIESQSSTSRQQQLDNSRLTSTSGSNTLSSESGVELSAEAQAVETQSGDPEAFILIGARNSSAEIPSGVGNLPVSAEVTSPSGATTLLNTTTNAKGFSVVKYSASESGNYDITISSRSNSIGGSAYTDFTTGQAAVFYPGITRSVQTGRPVKVGVALTDRPSFDPVAGTKRTVDISTPSGTINRTFTTNSDGIATFEFVPKETGSYRILERSIPENVLSYNEYEASDTVGKVRFNGESTDQIAPNQVAGIYGQLRTGGSTAKNKNIEVRIRNRSDNNIVSKKSTQTNGYGQFNVDWRTPNVSNSHSYDIEISPSSSTGTVGGSFNSEIELEPRKNPTSDTVPEIDVDLKGKEDYSAVLAPGEQVTAEVTITREDGSAASNVPVDLRGTIGYPGTIVASGQATTNSSGIAEIQFTVPQDIKRSDLRLNVYATVNGNIYEENKYPTIGNVKYEQQNDYRIESGDPINYTVTTTDASGNAVSDVTTYVFPEMNSFHASIVDSGIVTTDSDGEIQTTFTSQRSGKLFFGDFGKYNDQNSYSSSQISPYDVNIETQSGKSIYDTEYAAGETVILSYTDTATDTTKANLVVSAGDDDYERVEQNLLYNGQISSSEEATFMIPSTAPSGIDYEVAVSVATKSGTRVVETGRLDVTTSKNSSTQLPTQLQGDVTTAQYTAVLSGDKSLSAGNLADAINQWKAQGSVDGVDIGAGELSSLINYWAN